VGQARRPDPGPGTTEPLPAGVHHHPRPRCDGLAVAAHPQQARPNVTTPTARAAGVASLEIVVDTREQYASRFASQQVTTGKRALPCGDYGVTVDGRLVALVERKSLADLVFSLINGKLRYALGDLAALPRAAVVVADRYSQASKPLRRASPPPGGFDSRPPPLGSPPDAARRPSGRGRLGVAGELGQEADGLARQSLDSSAFVEPGVGARYGRARCSVATTPAWSDGHSPLKVRSFSSSPMTSASRASTAVG